VTIQAQILDLMRDLRNRTNTAVVLITHDLGIIAEMADRVAVMYAGRIVEQADIKRLFSTPLHPYTQGLIASIPVLGQVKDRLDVIPGSVPNLVDLPPGCRFASRCRLREEYGLEVCTQVEPELKPGSPNGLVKPDHLVRCWLYHDHGESGFTAPLKHD
jgi:oligopeptide/dipeptide ABC transporter ATP-binding protein